MTFQDFLFYAFSTILVAAACGVITARNPVHAALLLVLAFFSASGLWIQLQAEFLAITLVLVYVGAVMVLFLFVVMMLDINLAKLREGFWGYLPLGALVGVLLALEMGAVLWTFYSRATLVAPELQANSGNTYSNTRELGRLLYTEYVYPFEIAAVILLVAIVAAIALTLRKRKAGLNKYVDPAWQVTVKSRDRVRIVKMPADTGQD